MVQPTLSPDPEVTPALVRRLATALRELGLGEFFPLDAIGDDGDTIELPALTRDQARRLANRLEDVTEGRIESSSAPVDPARRAREMRERTLRTVLHEDHSVPLGFERPHVRSR